MIKLIKKMNKSIIYDDFDELTVATLVVSIVCAIIICVISGIGTFAPEPAAMGKLIHIAGFNSPIWRVVFIIECIAIFLGICSSFADSKYDIYDEERYIYSCYLWAFFICSGGIFITFSFILLYCIFKYSFISINFCLNHLFLLFASNDRKIKNINQKA